MSDPVTNPAVERVMDLASEWCEAYADWALDLDNEAQRDKSDRIYTALRAEIAAMVGALDAAESLADEAESCLGNDLVTGEIGFQPDKYAAGLDAEIGRFRTALSALRDRTPNPAEGGGEKK